MGCVQQGALVLAGVFLNSVRHTVCASFDFLILLSEGKHVSLFPEMLN